MNLHYHKDVKFLIYKDFKKAIICAEIGNNIIIKDSC